MSSGRARLNRLPRIVTVFALLSLCVAARPAAVSAGETSVCVWPYDKTQVVSQSCRLVCLLLQTALPEVRPLIFSQVARPLLPLPATILINSPLLFYQSVFVPTSTYRLQN